MKQVTKIPTDAEALSWRPGGLVKPMSEILLEKHGQVKAKECQ